MPAPRVLCHLAILMAVAVLARAAPAAAANEPYWRQSFPQLADPTPEFRPKVRSRPQGHTLEALAAAGFGGVEIGLDFRAEPQVAQQELHEQLQEAQRRGIHLDLAPGGSQPYESPGISEADSMQQLVSERVSVRGGTDYAAMVSQPAGLVGHATLVAVSAARVTDDSKTPVLLAASSVIDLTHRLDRSGVLHWRVPAGRWLLFSYWQRATGQVFSGNPFEEPSVWSSRVPQSGPGRYFTADLFSSAGISAALSYLDAHILPGNLALLRGGNLAHDSLEVQAQMFWTGDLPQQFRQRRGYSIIPYLPVLYTPGEASFNPLNPAWAATLPPRPFEFDDDTGARVRYDYERTLTDLYAERYLRAFSAWAHSRGLRSRVQVAYNYLALDMLRSARYVDITENESFDPGWARAFDPTLPAYGSERWRHVMDSYRLTGSGVHLAGAKRATIEFGDDFAIYRKQPVDYAQQLNESLAGGITMGLLTEFSSASTEWPTPQGGAALGLGDAWTAGWPQWRDWPALSRYFSRSTQVLESGQARIDVAIYHDRGVSTGHDTGPLFASDRLERTGYTYDFVDPLALATVQAAATSGMLYGHSAGYRALILDREISMPVEAARAILSLARHGLPVVVIGVPPRISSGLLHHTENDRAVERALAAMMRLGNAAHVDSADGVPGALQRLGCLPSASFGDRSTLLSVHRQTAEQDLWWIFNPTDTPVATRASFAAGGAPYLLDLWSGAGERVAQWSVEGQRMIVPLVVMPHATTVLLVHRGERPTRHVISSTAEQIVQHSDDMLVIDTRAGTQRLVLSDAQVRNVDLDGLPRPLDLSRWHLHVDEVVPAGPRQHDLDLASLADWRSMPDLKDAVGQGLYTAVLDLPSQWFGADRESILVVGEVAGAMQLSVNGHAVSEQTTGYGRWPIGQWLRPGDNTFTVRLDTTLLNRMAALRAAGDARYQTGPTPLPTAASGLIGPVTLISAARVPLAAEHQ
jgi:hypothetical protein